MIHSSCLLIRISHLTSLTNESSSSFPFLFNIVISFPSNKTNKGKEECYEEVSELHRGVANIHESALAVFLDPRVMEPKTDLRVALSVSRLRPVGVWAVDEELVIRPLRAP